MSGKQAPRLGRGLAALIRDHAPQAGSPDGPEMAGQGSSQGGSQAAGPRGIPIEFMEPSPFQPRRHITPDSLDELTASIRESGILQPLLVRPVPGSGPGSDTRYQIIAGERRWRAAQLAGLHEAPALIRTLSDQEAMAAGLVENLQRSDLNAIEEAEGFQRLVADFGMTHETLARAVGKSRSYVGNMIRLLRLPPEVQVQVRSGLLSAGHARALLLHPEPLAAANAAIEQNLSVRDLEARGLALTKNVHAIPDEHDGRRRPSAELADLEQRLSGHLGLRVRIAWNGRSGQVSVQVGSLDQLEGVVRLLKA